MLHRTNHDWEVYKLQQTKHYFFFIEIKHYNFDWNKISREAVLKQPKTRTWTQYIRELQLTKYSYRFLSLCWITLYGENVLLISLLKIN